MRCVLASLVLASCTPSSTRDVPRCDRAVVHNLIADGRIAKALETIEDQNATCPESRRDTWDVEVELLADLDRCDDARALASLIEAARANETSVLSATVARARCAATPPAVSDLIDASLVATPTEAQRLHDRAFVLLKKAGPVRAEVPRFSAHQAISIAWLDAHAIVILDMGHARVISTYTWKDTMNLSLPSGGFVRHLASFGDLVALASDTEVAVWNVTSHVRMFGAKSSGPVAVTDGKVAFVDGGAIAVVDLATRSRNDIPLPGTMGLVFAGGDILATTETKTTLLALDGHEKAHEDAAPRGFDRLMAVGDHVFAVHQSWIWAGKKWKRGESEHDINFCVSPDGQMAVKDSAHMPQNPVVDLATDKVLGKTTFYVPYACAISPDRHFVAYRQNRELFVRELATGSPVATVPFIAQRVTGACASAGARSLAVPAYTEQNGAITLFSGGEAMRVSGTGCDGFSPLGTFFVATKDDSHALVDTNGGVFGIFDHVNDWVATDDDRNVTVHGEHETVIFDTARRHVINRSAPTKAASPVRKDCDRGQTTWTHENRRVCTDVTATSIRVTIDDVAHELEAYRDTIAQVTVTPDARYIVGAFQEGSVVLWSTASHKIVLVYQVMPSNDPNDVAGYALAPDGRIDIYGDPIAEPMCRSGDVLYPFAICADRLKTPGLAGLVLGADPR